MKPESQNENILRGACPDETGRRRLMELLGETDPGPWFETVDDSSYALADWIEALLYFDSWLERESCAERPVATMLGYIHCCTLTLAETLALPSLTDLVRENLDQYGFDAVKPIS